jgi:hypothetical protein
MGERRNKYPNQRPATSGEWVASPLKQEERGKSEESFEFVKGG